MSAPAKKSEKGKFSGLMIGCLVAGVFLTIMVGLGALRKMTPDTPESQTTRTEQSHQVSSRQSATSEPKLPEMGVRRDLLAPPITTTEWSPWITVPSRRSFLSCEANTDLTCADTESDVSKINYAYQCKNMRGEVLDWSPTACMHYIAIRVRSKDDTARKLAYWFEPYNG